MDTHSASVFKLNQWFSKTEGDGKLVKEIPAETDGEEMLTSKLFGSAFCIQNAGHLFMLYLIKGFVRCLEFLKMYGNP